MDFVEVLKWQIKLENNLFVAVDVMVINNMPFIVSVSSNIKFNIVQNQANRNRDTLLGFIDAIIAHYSKVVFRINTILIDQELNAFEEDIIS